MNLTLKVWRQSGPEAQGRIETYDAPGIPAEASFLEMLDIVKERALEEGALNVMPVMGRIDHCGLEPSSVDIVLFVDAYHEFSHPREMMESIVAALKPGGRVYLVEYRLEDPFVLIKERHKMSEKQARLEMEAVGLAFVENIGVLPQQHILVFRRD